MFSRSLKGKTNFGRVLGRSQIRACFWEEVFRYREVGSKCVLKFFFFLATFFKKMKKTHTNFCVILRGSQKVIFRNKNN